MNTNYYQIAGITIAVSSDLSIVEDTFHPKFRQFEVREPGDDTIYLHHHFHLLDIERHAPGAKVYDYSPWEIYQSSKNYTYVWTSGASRSNGSRRAAVFSRDHARGVIYNDEISRAAYCAGNLRSLTMFPTDQILLTRLLGDRNGCMLHSSGLILDKKGLLFVGHSDAGKSTISRMMKPAATILCDDRNIVRETADGFKLYGTWSHGDVEEVSSECAGLKAVFFLKQAHDNHIARLENTSLNLQNLLACLVKSFVTAAWWNKTLDTIGELVRCVPCYELHFDRSGKIVPMIAKAFAG